MARTARQRNGLPTDPGLQEFAERFGVAPGIVLTDHAGRTDLRSSIRQAGSTFDMAQWRRRLGAVEVEYPEGTARGTGFLLRPEIVLTSSHDPEGWLAPRTDTAIPGS